MLVDSDYEAKKEQIKKLWEMEGDKAKEEERLARDGEEPEYTSSPVREQLPALPDKNAPVLTKYHVRDAAAWHRPVQFKDPDGKPGKLHDVAERLSEKVCFILFEQGLDLILHDIDHRPRRGCREYIQCR